jgi:glycosyltransferase involved in cell wall biosynthesis
MTADYPLSCSVIVPCRDEAENVGPLVDRLPQLGVHTELIFVDGASTDGTPERIEEIIRSHPERDIKLLHQSGKPGKAGAVFEGFDAASGDILIILDADMTVAPEDLPCFYRALAEGSTDFANGTRFLHPMEAGAMPRANALGNRAFSWFLSWLIGTRITDSLCGTKAFLRRDWPRLRPARPLFGNHDPWGDFDLLLAARCVGLRIVDVPVPYWARTAGESKMRPLKHTLPLLWTCLEGVRRLKLVPLALRRRDR